jgi:excisionase family DNA binding protein
MAWLFRPNFIDYRMPDGSTRDANGKRVNKKTPGAIGHPREGKTWHGSWVDANGKLQKKALSAKKGIAQRMLDAEAGKAQLASAGIFDRYADHQARPLIGGNGQVGHLEEWERYLRAKPKAGSEKQITQKVGRVRRLLEGCKFKTLEDLDAQIVAEWLAKERQGDAGPELPPGKAEFTLAEVAELLDVKPFSISSLVKRHRLEATGNGKARRLPRATVETLLARAGQGAGTSTSNYYAREIKSFCKWLAENDRVRKNPMGRLDGPAGNLEPRRARRAFTQTELGRLLPAASSSPTPFRGLTGPDRSMLYRVAISTGFREGELAELPPEWFRLDTDPPSVMLPARMDKAKKSVEQPLPPHLVEPLREYLRGRPAGVPVWPGTWAERGCDMLRVDLEAAGIPYVVDGPDGPVYADFHSLRHSYVALLELAGCTLKQAMALARHSDPKLTMARYGKATLYDLGGAVGKLPEVMPGTAPGPRSDSNREPTTEPRGNDARTA